MRKTRGFIVFQMAFALTVLPAFCLAQEEPQWTAEQQRDFLLTAKPINSKRLDQGITRSFRVTLQSLDGKITHYAHFQSIDERRAKKELERGVEYNFVDSYLYNIAAYELSKLIGLDNMVPVTVRRKWEGKTGAMAWWLPTKMDFGEWQEKKITPPNPEAFNNAYQTIQIFTELIYDTDRYNPGNIKVGNNWELYMLDFTRAFRLFYYLKNPENLTRCSRQLLEKLRGLDPKELSDKLEKPKYLTKSELRGVVKRRDKIVAIYDKLISEKGEAAVLY